MYWFWALVEVPGFTDSVVPGVSIEAREARHQARQAQTAASGRSAMEVDERDRWEQERSGDWEDEGEEAREENVAALMYQMSVLAVDREEMNGANPRLS
jgi:hypothetical protein